MVADLSPLTKEPNIVTTPHAGSAAESTRAAMADLAADNILHVLAGCPPRTPIPG
ncbi:hypothetical protein ACSCBZ_20400 [Streptomyces niveiscabiei]|uniref:hypothetical protein n=1 Tax=Streptomyces niveiscabiei TaxID=164115 RepID=UPI003EBA847B